MIGQNMKTYYYPGSYPVRLVRLLTAVFSGCKTPKSHPVYCVCSVRHRHRAQHRRTAQQEVE